MDHVAKSNNTMEEFQFNLNNMHVELPEEEATTGAVQEAIKEALHNKAAYLMMNAQTKKEATIKFKDNEEAKKAESALKERFNAKGLKVTII